LTSLTGNFRLHHRFHSRHVPDDRDIIVCLPPDYEESTWRRYPVFYLHDGQNLFDEETAFAGQVWRADETAGELIREGAIHPVIMVGIYNAGVRRIDEYTPTTDTHGHSGGKADLYAAMIVEELKPFIDANYRTLTAPADTAMGGSSLGALVTLYIGLRHPELFGKLAIMSPSVWWNRGVILRMIRDMPIPEPRPLLWVDIGTAEGHQPNRILRDARNLREVLRRKGWKEGEDLAYVEEQGALHNEAAWSLRMPRMLRFLFGRFLFGGLEMKIQIVTTGGTIEKVYSEQSGQVENVTAKIDRYLQSLRLPDTLIEVTPLMNKDSLEMTDHDRELILSVVQMKVAHGPVVITHGTDTMVETGRLLKAGLPDLKHSVVLTGAMTPLGFERSDGLQNLTESLFAARVLPAGVWIVIHNQVFDVDHARKDRENARFVMA
jgi:predicted alpha/beta superfamily hydrolase